MKAKTNNFSSTDVAIGLSAILLVISAGLYFVTALYLAETIFMQNISSPVAWVLFICINFVVMSLVVIAIIALKNNSNQRSQ